MDDDFDREPHEQNPFDAPACHEVTFTGGNPELRDRIVERLKTCYDPEIPVDIYELGLIYNVEIGPESQVDIRMTLTSPMCPVAGSLPGEVETKVQSVEGVSQARVQLVWEPTWGPQNMSEVARVKLGF